jgi:sugar lactone lactonase YvrE
VGPDGSIYIADTMNFVVRVIDPDGIMHTFAGTGVRGFEGDGGPADEAQLDRPYGVDVDPETGVVYIADTHNQRVRRVTSTLPDDFDPDALDETPDVEIIPCTGEVGSICTYVGSGYTGYNGDGLDALQTTLYWPFDIEFFSNGRQVFMDWNNHKVREILPDNTIATIMGTDFIGDGPFDLSDLEEPGADPLTVNLNHPTDAIEMPNEDILVVAWHNHKLRVIDADTGRVLVLAGAGAMGAPAGEPGPGDGGPAVDARFNQPSHAVLDPDGNLFLVDQRNQRIRVFYNFVGQRSDATVQTIVGTGAVGFNGDGLAGLETEVSFPTGGNPEPTGGLALDADGMLYFSDSNNNRIRRVEFLSDDFTESIVTTIAGTGEAGYSGDGGPATEAQLEFPQDMEIGPDGALYFADANNHVVRRINLETGIIEAVAGTGVKGYSGDGGPAIDAQLNRPFGVAFDDSGDLYVSDTFNSRIRKVVMPR